MRTYSLSTTFIWGMQDSYGIRYSAVVIYEYKGYDVQYGYLNFTDVDDKIN